MSEFRGRIRDDDIADVRERARIEEVVEPHTTLRRAGGDSLKGLCPFHDENTPSFHVTPSRGMFYCHGCQEGGDTIHFVQQIEQVSFPEAVRLVADRVGVDLRQTEPDDPAAAQRARRYAILAAADRFFRDRLASPEAVEARRFLDQRGFTRDQADDAGCGYAPADGAELLRMLRGTGYDDADMIDAGVARRGSRGLFAFFRDRLLWPITDTTSRVVGFGARKLSDDDPVEGKYVNSPESDVFHKANLLYGLDQARKAARRAGRIVVVEGYTDVMACRAAGVEETVATCGTSFGQRHLQLLTRAVGADTSIVFCFDGDAAGQRAAARAWTVARDVLNRVYGVHLDVGVDPCELRQSEGDQALVGTLEQAEPLTGLVVAAAADDAVGDDQTPEDRSRAVGTVADLLRQVPDPVLRDGYIRPAADRLGVSAGQLQSAVDATSRPADPEREPPQPQQAPAAGSSVLALERRMLHRLAADPQAASAWLDTLEESLFAAPTAQAVLRLLKTVATPGDVATLRPATWAGRVLDNADPDTRQAVSRMLAEPVDDVEPAVLFTVGCARLEENLLRTRLDEARAQLSTATGEDQDAWMETVVDLDAQLTSVRARLAGEPSDI